ncbi:hypothetical protein IAD21_04768 [Abditibacteriota bacterium]|nr:hypothetical protein IAD21_04768 [Abditibacteriota bacterium]
MASLCPSCGYQLDPFDPTCPRCARGLNTVVAVVCPTCQKTNPVRLYACSECDTRLPTTLEQVTKQPLEKYQQLAETSLSEGKARKAIITLFEASEFYPTALPIRQRLIELLKANGHGSMAATQERALYLVHIQASEGFGIDQATNLFGRGQFPLAIDVLQQVVHFHPRSIGGHDLLAACYEATGEVAKGQAERAIANQLKVEFERNKAHQHQQADARAHANESAAMTGGAALGVTGAAVGTGITFISIITGIGTMILGVLLCVLAFLLCCTCIGIVPGIMLLGTGFAMVGAGFAVMIGGTAAGAATGAAGVASGGLVGGMASRNRASRENSKRP